DRLAEVALRNGAAVDSNPLAVRLQVRLGVQAATRAGRAEDAGQHGARRALALRSRHQRDPQLLIRRTRQIQQRPRAAQLPLAAGAGAWVPAHAALLVGQAVEPVQRSLELCAHAFALWDVLYGGGASKKNAFAPSSTPARPRAPPA